MFVEVRIPGDGYRSATVTVAVVVVRYPPGWPGFVGMTTLGQALERLEGAGDHKAIFTNTRVQESHRDACGAREVLVLEGPLEGRREPDTATVTAAVRRLFAG